jgi:hypothetical protein
LRAADTIGSKIEKVQLTRLARLSIWHPKLPPPSSKAVSRNTVGAHLRRLPALPPGWDEQKALSVFS